MKYYSSQFSLVTRLAFVLVALCFNARSVATATAQEHKPFAAVKACPEKVKLLRGAFEKTLQGFPFNFSGIKTPLIMTHLKPVPFDKRGVFIQFDATQRTLVTYNGSAPIDGKDDAEIASKLREQVDIYAKYLEPVAIPGTLNTQSVYVVVHPSLLLKRLIPVLEPTERKYQVRVLVGSDQPVAKSWFGQALPPETRARVELLEKAEPLEQTKVFAHAFTDAAGTCQGVRKVLGLYSSFPIGRGPEAVALTTATEINTCQCQGMDLPLLEGLMLTRIMQQRAEVPSVRWIKLGGSVADLVKRYKLDDNASFGQLMEHVLKATK